MVCNSCGNQIVEGATFCMFCGSKVDTSPQAASGTGERQPETAGTRSNGFAIWSLVCGILTVFTCGITAPIGVILGILGLTKAKNMPGRSSGEGLAIAGIAISGVGGMFMVVVVPILAAILFPVFARATEKARTASCQSNLKQISLGLAMYRDDFDNTNPPAKLGEGGWSGTVMPYVRNKQILHCPSATSPGLALSYEWNKRLAGLKDKAVADPPTLVLMWDSDANGVASSGGCPQVAARHNEGANAAFYDGHVKWLKPESPYFNCENTTPTYGPHTEP